jgi:hypothetical protein
MDVTMFNVGSAILQEEDHLGTAPPCRQAQTRGDPLLVMRHDVGTSIQQETGGLQAIVAGGNWWRAVLPLSFCWSRVRIIISGVIDDDDNDDDDDGGSGSGIVLVGGDDAKKKKKKAGAGRPLPEASPDGVLLVVMDEYAWEWNGRGTALPPPARPPPPAAAAAAASAQREMDGAR